MRRDIVLVAGFLILGGALLACGEESNQSDEDRIEAAAADFRTEIQEFRADALERLDSLGTNIAELDAEADEATGEGKARLAEQVQELEERLGRLEDRVKRMEAETPEAWRELKSGVESSLAELRRSIDHAFAEEERTEGTGS